MAWERNRPPMRPGWAAKRRRILARDPVCRICRKRPATEVDHRVSRAQGGGDSESNLRGVCRRCHAIRTQRQSAAARKAAGKPRKPADPVERQRTIAVKRGRQQEAEWWAEIARRG